MSGLTCNPRTKRHKSRRERLAKPPKQTESHSRANIYTLSIVRASNTPCESTRFHDLRVSYHFPSFSVATPAM